MKIFNQTRGTLLADKAWAAQGFFARARGLLGRKKLVTGQALVIPFCQGIHMFFMRFAIDAVFVDQNNTIVGLVKKINPFCLSPIFFKAYFVVELPAGTIEATQTQTDDKLRIEE